MTTPPTRHAQLDDTAHRLRPDRPVIVGIDGSREARRGLLFAADLADTLGVDLVVVHAYGLIGTVGDWRSGVETREREVQRAMVDDWCEPLADRSGLRWQWRCVQGSAVEGILRTADEFAAGFIVVGSHGVGGSTSALLGSTSQSIVRHSHRPVVVVPPADDHEHRRAGTDAVSGRGDPPRPASTGFGIRTEEETP